METPMGYIDPWQIPTQMPVRKPKEDDEERDGIPASEELLEAAPQRGRVSPRTVRTLGCT
jgi:hypothetical protein